MRLVRAGVLCAMLAACGSDDDPRPTPRDAGPSCEVDPAAPGCVGVGVLPDGCAEGFASDGRGGCEPVLPADPCGPGLLAVPGDMACREVAPCPDGRWGDAPIEATTQFVDAAYAAGSNDGTEAHPWRTIQEGIDAADPGAVVAIAAGSYVEDVDVDGKRVRIWGRCPAMVELAATGGKATQALLVLHENASGTEVHSIAVTGPIHGLGVTGAVGVLFDRIWLHDTKGRGFVVQDILGETGFIVRDSLIEGALEFGVFVVGASVELDRTVVRDTRPRPTDQQRGRGISLQYSEDTKRRSSGTVRASVIERNFEGGIAIFGSDASIEGSILRDTAAEVASAELGRGINVQSQVGEHGVLSLRGSLLERNTELAMAVIGADATVESTVFRDTRARADGLFGAGVGVKVDETDGTRATMSMSHSLVDRCFQTGIYFAGATGTLDAVLIRDTAPQPADAGYGDGLVVIGTASDPVDVQVTGSLLQGNARAGILAFGGDATLGSTALECNAIDLDGEPYMGQDFDLSDLGGNVCGCAPKHGACSVLTSSLAPPPSL